MRGEHLNFVAGGNADTGSSPHARGARLASLGMPWPNGIIPACAGSTRCFPGRRRELGDHPRMRGEHRPVARTPLPDRGSSPHARGAHLVGGGTSPRLGIIPACAGSTLARPRETCPSWDHPRMRGEHSVAGGTSCGHGGSSPHARGAHSSASGWNLRSGIIPACAGSTVPVCVKPCEVQDHPRMRGEHRICNF